MADKSDRGEACRPAPSYRGLSPASARASTAARGASKKHGTRPELRLRRALWARGYRYRVDVAALPGRPDIVLGRARVAVFCDGDYWHGKDWPTRRAKLERGHNGAYWIAKIERNMARDSERTAALEAAGWTVIRVWESDINRALDATLATVVETVELALAKHG